MSWLSKVCLAAAQIVGLPAIALSMSADDFDRCSQKVLEAVKLQVQKDFKWKDSLVVPQPKVILPEWGASLSSRSTSIGIEGQSVPGGPSTQFSVDLGLDFGALADWASRRNKRKEKLMKELEDVEESIYARDLLVRASAEIKSERRIRRIQRAMKDLLTVSAQEAEYSLNGEEDSSKSLLIRAKVTVLESLCIYESLGRRDGWADKSLEVSLNEVLDEMGSIDYLAMNTWRLAKEEVRSCGKQRNEVLQDISQLAEDLSDNAHGLNDSLSLAVDLDPDSVAYLQNYLKYSYSRLRKKDGERVRSSLAAYARGLRARIFDGDDKASLRRELLKKRELVPEMFQRSQELGLEILELLKLGSLDEIAAVQTRDLILAQLELDLEIENVFWDQWVAVILEEESCKDVNLNFR